MCATVAAFPVGAGECSCVRVCFLGPVPSSSPRVEFKCCLQGEVFSEGPPPPALSSSVRCSNGRIVV